MNGFLRQWRAEEYPPASTPEARTVIPEAAASALNSAQYSIVVAFRLLDSTTFRNIWTENGDAFNKISFIRVATNGEMQWHSRAPDVSINLPNVPGGAVDDGVWHTCGLTRRSTGSNLFTFTRDDVIRQTTTLSPTPLSSETTTRAWGNWDTGAGAGDDALDGLLAHGYIVDIDLTTAQQAEVVSKGKTPVGNIVHTWQTGTNTSTVVTEIGP